MLRRNPEEVLRFVVDYKRGHDGNSPSVREIQEGLGWDSTSTVAAALRRLEQAGKVRLTGYPGTRGIEVVGGRWDLTPPNSSAPHPSDASFDGGGVEKETANQANLRE